MEGLGVDFRRQAEQVRWLAQTVAAKGWLPATSGNLSVKVSDAPLRFAITRSGADKQRLALEDVLLVGPDGGPVVGTPHRPSAETVVHVRLYQTRECGAIVHVHTMFNNLASDVFFPQGYVELADHELLKALGHWEEGARIRVPIVENHHDLNDLAAAVADMSQEGVPGVLVRNHGIYAWGEDADAALRHLEAFEFLFEYVLRRRVYGGGLQP
ncbi:methylthioribulose 1-phosphate dehydratase [Alicyclobacillus sp.]|uniref:methylthioribulose 1-phosphate dehydratase n=1 Tax=Alicyclobacillus sp. TaxID=61169 RepID=UPI0025C6250B|nr:methylthioribulose 1-phosphate dehydratase [Alicyclobacillus sp.]MCL6517229.1 methylthioribulose 1-phosphate dehydratase [Alicyclobacillus sp.]